MVGSWCEEKAAQAHSKPRAPIYHGGAPTAATCTRPEADILQATAGAQAYSTTSAPRVTVAYRASWCPRRSVPALGAAPAVEQSAERLRIVRERYRGGTGALTDVIDAETAAT